MVYEEEVYQIINKKLFNRNRNRNKYTHYKIIRITTGCVFLEQPRRIIFFLIILKMTITNNNNKSLLPHFPPFSNNFRRHWKIITKMYYLSHYFLKTTTTKYISTNIHNITYNRPKKRNSIESKWRKKRTNNYMS